jgi:STE24 endopeptidase
LGRTRDVTRLGAEWLAGAGTGRAAASSARARAIAPSYHRWEIYPTRSAALTESSLENRSEPDAEARRYHRRQLWLSIADFAASAGVLVAWLATGAAKGLAAALAAGLPPLAVVAGLALAIGLSSAVVTFPLDLLAGHVLPRRAGLSHQGFGAWLGDKGKAWALGGLLGLLAVEIVYALLAWAPAWWWLAAAAILAGGAVLLAAVLPIWIVPLFYRLTPLGDPDVRDRLLALAGRVGVPAATIEVADFSRKGRTANAAVVGLGRTRRILVSDTLLVKFPLEEVEVVLAHELAHHARGHLAQGLVLQSGLLLALLGLTDRVLRAAVPALDLAGPADPAGLPLLALVLTGLGLLAAPVGALWSRRLECEADAVALAVTRAPTAFIAAMERLGALNLAERRPNRVKQWLFASHPSLEERIAAGRAALRQAAGPP